jgi:YHS domain-containing protein
MIVTRPLPARVRIFAAVLAIAAFAANAWTGEFYEKDGVAIKGYDPVAFFKDGKPVKGSPEHKADYKGSVFHFSSKANRDVFARIPRGTRPNTAASVPSAWRAGTRRPWTLPRSPSSITSST